MNRSSWCEKLGIQRNRGQADQARGGLRRRLQRSGSDDSGVRWEPDAHAICTLSSKCTRLKRIIATTDEIHLEAAQLVDISGNFVHHSLNFGIGKGHHFKVSDGSD